MTPATERNIVQSLRVIMSRLDSIEQRLMAPDTDLVNVAQAAEMLGKTKNAIRQMVCRGQINAEHAPNGQLRFRRGHIREIQNQLKQ